jgi:hypothetical protein
MPDPPPKFFRSLDFQLPTFHPDGEYIWLAECHCAVVLQIIVLLEVSIRRLAKASSFPTIAFWEAYRFLDFLVELHRDLPIVLVPESRLGKNTSIDSIDTCPIF